MISIRANVFESNSSSCHSITFSSENSGHQNVPITLDFRGNDFGWAREVYSDPQSKLEYWLSAYSSLIRLRRLEEMRKLLKLKDLYWISTKVAEDGSSGPCDAKVYQDTANEVLAHLKAVFEALQQYGVRLHFAEYDNRDNFVYDFGSDIEDYLSTLKEVNTARDVTKLCDPDFNFLVKMGYGIDHQSDVREDGDCRCLAESTPDEVVDWILGDGSVETGNDNEDYY